MSARPPPELIRLLKDVPNYFRLVQTGLTDVSVYDEAQLVIDKHRSDAFIEWSHLEQFMRQDVALLRALSRAAPIG